MLHVTYVTVLNLERKKKKIKSLGYRKKANYQITQMVCILTTLATYKFFWSKITASCGVLCVTLIRLPFKHENCDQISFYFLADMCIFQNVLIILY